MIPGLVKGTVSESSRVLKASLAHEVCVIPSPKKAQVLLSAHLQVLGQNHSFPVMTILLDSGAAGNFIDEAMIRRLQIL